MVRVAGSVDVGLAARRGDPYGNVFERASETAHLVSLKVREHNHGVVVREVLSNEILFYLPPVGHRKLHISVGVHYVNGRDFRKAVFLYRFGVFFGRIPPARIRGVAFHERPADTVYYGLYEVGRQKIMPPGFARVEFHRHLSARVEAERLVCRKQPAGRYVFCKIDLRTVRPRF